MIAVIDCCGNNLASLRYALERLETQYAFTCDPDIIQSAERVILPGVGHAEIAMQNLQQMGLLPIIQKLRQPVLGICLGMQLLFEHTEEGNTQCLGVIPGRVVKMQAQKNLTVPHMGWHALHFNDPADPIKRLLENDQHVYFVHSYYVPESSVTRAFVQYGDTVSAIVEHNNFMGMQFHPEKSGLVGEKLLHYFLSRRIQ